MIIITLVLLFQGVLSQSITVTPNTTSIDILKGGNSTIEYKINPGLSNDWVVEMNFGDSFHDFFIHRSGQPYTPPEECLNCNVTFNNLTTTFTLNLYNVTNDNIGTYIGTDTVFEVWYEAYPVPKFKWTFLAENGIEDEDVTSSFLVVNVVDGTYRFRSLLLLNRTYTRRTGHYRIDIWNFLGHASSQIYIQDSKAVHVNVYKVLLLTILCIVFPIYIVIECTIRIKKRRNATELRKYGNCYKSHLEVKSVIKCYFFFFIYINRIEDSNKQGSAYSSVSERDIDGDGYLNMKEHRIPVFCIRQDPNEQDLTESSVSGGDKDADGYLIMKGQNIPDNCKRYVSNIYVISTKEF
ncbi:hypothetical protein KUTeg_006260 [Tegillarca granosa]|uniref:Uncharacterized protein n=1 Tax=Tegillarca granosa TaxID=220873 RepID=A0ABQ9FHW0_TEGGR|nr:hypothetical protein KUTeg_006260 [Tegillarca granosa]